MPPQDDDGNRQQYGGNSNPQEFARQDREATGAEESPHSNWRNPNRSPRKEVTVVVEGENNAIPRAPSVKASSNPWLAVARKRYSHNVRACISVTPCRNPSTTVTSASRAAKNSECAKPRCPQKSP